MGAAAPSDPAPLRVRRPLACLRACPYPAYVRAELLLACPSHDPTPPLHVPVPVPSAVGCPSLTRPPPAGGGGRSGRKLRDQGVEQGQELRGWEPKPQHAEREADECVLCGPRPAASPSAPPAPTAAGRSGELHHARPASTEDRIYPPPWRHGHSTHPISVTFLAPLSLG